MLRATWESPSHALRRSATSPRTLELYSQLHRRWMRDRGGDVVPTLEAAQAWLGTLTAPVAKAARAALRWAYPDAECLWSRRLRLPRVVRREVLLGRTVLSREEEWHIRAVCSVREAALIAALAVLRRAEVATWCWSEVDVETGVVGVVGKGRTGKLTALRLPDGVAAVRAWWEACQRPQIGLVFPSRAGTAASPRQVHRWVQAILQRAELQRPYRSAHAMRRTFATRYAEAHPGDTLGLRDAMRHASVSTTERYVYLDPREIRRRIQAIG